MIRQKKTKGYHNIFILILILVILFFFGRIILNRNSYVKNRIRTSEFVKLELSSQPSSENNFLVHAIYQVFPIKKVEKKLNIEKSFYKPRILAMNGLFSLDFKQPVSFLKTQFPATALYDIEYNGETAVGSKNIEDSLFIELVNDKDSISAANTKGEKEINSIENVAKDDLGETTEGIFLVGEEDIIDSLSIQGGASINNVKKPKNLQYQKGKPHILIYHTHGTESYKPASEGNYHTLRKDYSVMRVGSILKDELEKRGYNVIHDGTYHDYPSYSGSYTRSLKTARDILAANPSIKVVLDIHRDGYDNIETNPNRTNIVASNRIKINNKTSAKFQLVIGPESENRREIETFATFIKAVSDNKYPGFSKPILLKPYGRFNQFVVDHCALLEVGSNANTIEEAELAALYLADVLGDVLEHIKQ